MPLLLAGAAGLVGGFFIGSKTDELVKIAVIGGIAYYVYKKVK